jgi:hypothetical protein
VTEGALESSRLWTYSRRGRGTDLGRFRLGRVGGVLAVPVQGRIVIVDLREDPPCAQEVESAEAVIPMGIVFRSEVAEASDFSPDAILQHWRKGCDAARHDALAGDAGYR